MLIAQTAHAADIFSSETIVQNVDTELQLGIGDAVIVSNNMEITILDVQDSRCPADAFCVWQGEAKVSINVKTNSEDLGNFILSSISESSSMQYIDGYFVRLVQVEPYPLASQSTSPSDYVVTLTVSDNANLSPLKQFRSGIELDKIKCKPSYQLVMKKTNGSPACLKLETIPKLIERGWAVHVLPEISKDAQQNSSLYQGGAYEITTSDVSYFGDAAGYVARPSDDGVYPGVILIHEWWGLNENIKEIARSLASHGYVVLAADLYAGQVATTPDGARQLVTTFDQQKGIENLAAASNFLRENYDAEKISTIGWCFGGGQSLNYALSGNELDATVIYYGRLVADPEQLSVISWPVLGIFGELDSGITVESVREFESALNQLEIENEIYIYEGADHAFANPSGERHAPEATKDAWQKTVSFLEKHLK